MKIFGFDLSGNSTREKTISKEPARPNTSQQEVELDIDIPAQHLIETRMLDLFNRTPGLETVWKASLMWRVHFSVSQPFIFHHDYIDATEYRRLARFYQTYVLEAEKPVVEEFLKIGRPNTNFLGFVWFGNEAVTYGDRNTLDSIMINALRLFTEPEFANDLLDLNDRIESWKEDLNERDVLTTKMKLVAAKGSRSEKQDLLEKLRRVHYRLEPEVELEVCKSYIQTYKQRDHNNDNSREIQWAWKRMIHLIALRDGDNQASALADQLEQKQDVYSGPDELRKSLRDIRADLRSTLVKKEEYDIRYRSMAELSEQNLMNEFYGAVKISDRFAEAETILAKM